jgi:hypothetical protein
VTGFVVYALAQTVRAEALVHSGAAELVRRQRPNGGWGYNGMTPPDADSTAWALLALAASGASLSPAAAERGRRYLRAHQTSSGGFSTYGPSDDVGTFIGAVAPGDLQGWLAPQVCVTATALQALVTYGEPMANVPLQTAARYLADAHAPDELWRTYWWQGPQCPTFQALRAVVLALPAALPGLHAAAAMRLVAGQQPDGGWADVEGATSLAFATAFGLLTLALLPSQRYAAAVARAVAWLLAHQRSDGSWEAAPILRIPSPLTLDPAATTSWRIGGLGTGVVLADEQRIFTTAASAWALARAAGLAAVGPGQS